jgi:hypothetical protein
MNTGIPKGGGSPQGSNPTSNIRFPIRTAPVEAYISSTITHAPSACRDRLHRLDDWALIAILVT